MNNHVIDLDVMKKLTRLESASDYQGCCNLLSGAIPSIEEIHGDDGLYELGVAYLQLSIYHLICGEDEQYSEAMGKARKMLPETDLLALAAKQLAHSETTESRLREYCTEFFEVVDEGYKDRDGISRYYFESMVELRDRLSKA